MTKNRNSQRLILCLDIGNTSTTLGISCGKGIMTSGRMATADVGHTAKVRAAVRPLFSKTSYTANDLTAAVICSVVPQAGTIMKTCWPMIFPGMRVYMLGSDIHFPVRNSYGVPRQVGKDRLANAVAVKYFYRVPAVIVDFGTAITIDIVNKEAEYIGGLICPGLQMGLAALHENTALLPKAELALPKGLIGKDTRSSMLSGVVYGAGFGVDGVIRALKKRIKSVPVVIGTGGHAFIMKHIIQEVDVIDQFLTLKGIEKSYFKTKKRD